MGSVLHLSILAGALALVTTTAEAQGELILIGHIAPCNGSTFDIHLQTWPGTLPALDTVVQSGPDCNYYVPYHATSAQGYFNVSISCDGGVTTITDTAFFDTGFLGTDTVRTGLSCSGGYDCAGVLGGPALPGTACDDGDTLTLNDAWTVDCVCVGAAATDCLGIPNGPNMPGTTCLVLHEDSTEAFGTWTTQCICVQDSAFLDCLGQPNGTNMPGTSCDDGDPLTFDDVWSAGCVCAGSIPSPCAAGFFVVQNIGPDSLPVPNELALFNYSSGSGVCTYLWDFGDGTSSTQNTPIHTYADNGPYYLCLTIADGVGCSDTYCDSLSVDENGILRSSGFTVVVQDPLSTGIAEEAPVAGLRTWPNPVSDELNMAFTSSVTTMADITVVDMKGGVVRSERVALARGKNTLRIPLADLDAGLYVLRIGTAGHVTVQRFVKTR